MLREYTAEFVQRYREQAPPQVQSVLAKLALCRTAALGGHVYKCPQCQSRCPVYNSCLERHCPLCRGGRRADWLAATGALLLPDIDYFQVVFTMPDELSGLLLGNRRETYRLLFHAAWDALREVLQEELGCEPAALMVLHTWNQRLDHHAHVHAVVPGGGPSLDGQRWVRSGPRTHRRRQKPYLVDNRLLSARFRDKFLAGLTRLHRRGELKLEGEWSHLQEAAAFAAWRDTFREGAWVVYIEPPPNGSEPEHVLKYLARYLTGGPISDRRLISDAEGQVTFWVRSKDKARRNQRERYRLSGVEFTRRWALHILPQRFVKSRCFGGFSCQNRAAYLRRCRTLLDGEPRACPGTNVRGGAMAEAFPSAPVGPVCPRCETAMERIAEIPRPSWKRAFRGRHRPAWYAPWRPVRASGPGPQEPEVPGG